MRIKTLKLENWGPHKSLKLDMDSPVFGLLGPNASGKSNIMEAIAFAFTGILERNQETYVRRSKDEDVSNGIVEIEFLKGGAHGRIYRRVGKSPERKLWWDGAKTPLTKEREVAKKMEEILDCDKKAIDAAVFLSQGNIAAFLAGTPTQREEDFARICLVNELQLVADIAGQEVLRLQKTVTDLTSQKDEAESSREHAETALRVSEEDLKRLPDMSSEISWYVSRAKQVSEINDLGKMAADAMASYTAVTERIAGLVCPTGSVDPVVRRDELLALRALVEDANNRVAALNSSIEAHRSNKARVAELASAINESASIGIKLCEVDAKEAELNRAIQIQQIWVPWKTRKDELENSILKGTELISDLETKLQALASDFSVEVKALEAEDGKLNSELYHLDLVVSVHGRISGCCPLCGGADLSRVPDPVKAKEEISLKQARRKEIAARLLEISRTKETRDAEDAKLSVYRKVLEERKTELANHLAGKPVEPTSTLNLAAETQNLENLRKEARTLREKLAGMDAKREEMLRLDKLTAAFDEPAALRQLGDLRKDTNRGSELSELPPILEYLKRKAELEAEREAAAHTLAERKKKHEIAFADFEASIRTGPVNFSLSSSSPVHEWEAVIADLREKQNARVKAQGMVDANVSALRRAENRCAEIENRISVNAATVSVISQLEDLKSAFSRSGIPRHYLVKVFDAIVGMTQDNLANWDTDFQIEKDPDKLFNFLFFRSSDPVTLFDQSQLSGGQKTRLALSFVQAVQNLLYPGLDFLCVDEPSNHLDQEGVEGLIRLFQTIASQNAEGESQVIVVDHNPLLQKALSRSVTLERLA